MRKGQTLCNYIQRDNQVSNEKLHMVLFNMSDEEFDNAFISDKEDKQK